MARRFLITYSTTLLISLSFLVGEIHTFWEKNSQKPVNWIWNRSVPMSVQWNIKFIGLQAMYIMWGVAMYMYAKYPNRVNRATVMAFILFSLVDTLMYFYNYKTYGYGFLYSILLILWILAYLWQTPRRK